VHFSIIAFAFYLVCLISYPFHTSFSFISKSFLLLTSSFFDQKNNFAPISLCFFPILLFLFFSFS
jgi:prepilin signal peptidase PulO-like enzyme (type II secretory pathway)